MQTFLPYANFKQTAQCLDYRRLGKQRVEAFQILDTIENGGGWKNHPAVNMWRGYTSCLAWYGIAICDEWIARGYKDTMRARIAEFTQYMTVEPSWLGDPNFHRSHQSNLLRKNATFYKIHFPNVPEDLPYVWPV